MSCCSTGRMHDLYRRRLAHNTPGTTESGTLESKPCVRLSLQRDSVTFISGVPTHGPKPLILNPGFRSPLQGARMTFPSGASPNTYPETPFHQNPGVTYCCRVPA